ncbi:MAG TPA: hypothetical protein VFE62_05510 [Gemmataceae bacterium]|nr:hypothetical protein [Gemmataceae bacterium]
MSNCDGREIEIDVSGLGIILYSPRHAAHIAEGFDYLRSSYRTLKQVQAHLQDGTIVAFYTGSPGIFFLTLHDGPPPTNRLSQCEFKLQLGLHCAGGQVNFRDLYDLMRWTSECPAEQTAQMLDGYYQVTLCSEMPESSIIGNNQSIDIYFEARNAPSELCFPSGGPHLCY